MAGVLYLGTRRYSSWSLRGWLAVRLAGLDVEDRVVPLAGGVTPALQGLTPNGLVPALVHNGVSVWESLAICEYCAEQCPGLWPPGAPARARARSVAAEMHAGFAALRGAMPMNLGRSAPLSEIPEPVARDITRIETIWRECLSAGGPFLFGPSFGLADAMYAPVVARLLSYHVPLADPSRDYCAAVRAHRLVDEWYRLAAAEPESWRLQKYE